MSISRLAAARLLLLLATVATPLPALQAQPAPEPDKQLQAIQNIQKLLNETVVETKHFHKEMPFAKFLDALEKQLPKDKKVALRIDKEAFGPKFAEVAATGTHLQPTPQKMSLRNALEWVLLHQVQYQAGVDFRIGATDVVITTPQRAQYTAGYDIRALMEQPIFWTWSGPGLGDFKANRKRELTQRAALIVQQVYFVLRPVPAAQEPIQILNGTRLVLRTTDLGHARVTDLLPGDRGGLTVSVTAQLHEVDEAFYKKLKSAKRIPWEELERQFLEDIVPKGESFLKLLNKQTLILAGDAIQVDNGGQVALLSRYLATPYPPSREQAKTGLVNKQAVLDGVQFVAGIQVSADRRSVQVKLTEKATQLQGIQKVKVWVPGVRPQDSNHVDAAVPFLLETTQAQVLDIADGGTILVAVQYRPRSVQEKDRWWVLTIAPRIILEEEERQIRLGTLESLLPELVGDVLKNPRLKAVREMYGTPGDKRFALVDSATWSRPKEFQPKVAGYQFSLAERAGQRLLGIRIDHQQDADLTVTLVNAGGSANGAAIGSCTLHYTVRQGDKGWVVKLVEPMNP